MKKIERVAEELKMRISEIVRNLVDYLVENGVPAVAKDRIIYVRTKEGRRKLMLAEVNEQVARGSDYWCKEPTGRVTVTVYKDRLHQSSTKATFVERLNFEFNPKMYGAMVESGKEMLERVKGIDHEIALRELAQTLIENEIGKGKKVAPYFIGYNASRFYGNNNRLVDNGMVASIHFCGTVPATEENVKMIAAVLKKNGMIKKE